MSMPKMLDINPKVNISRDAAANIVIASIAMEELALAHILNAEGEKLQYVLGTLEGSDPGEVTICDVMAVNESIHRTMRDVIKTEMLLQLKLEDAIEITKNTTESELTISGKKTWIDNDNAGGTRPSTIEIRLLRDGEPYKSVTLDSMGDGAYVFSCLPEWKDSKTKYVYQVDEAVVPANYTKEINGFNITNTLTTP